MQQTKFKIITCGGLPQGYNERDYFKDRGKCLDQVYASMQDAKKAIKRNYLGPDVDGVGADWLIMEVRD